MRESILENTGAPSQGHLQVQVEGAGAGPLRGGGPDQDPDLGDPGGDPDLGDPAPGLITVRPQWRRLNSSWSLTSLSFVRNTN